MECADSSVPYPVMPFRVCHPCQEQYVTIQLKCIEYTQVNANGNRRFCPYFGRY